MCGGLNLWNVCSAIISNFQIATGAPAAVPAAVAALQIEAVSVQAASRVFNCA